jgi:hypothetical protein
VGRARDRSTPARAKGRASVRVRAARRARTRADKRRTLLMRLRAMAASGPGGERKSAGEEPGAAIVRDQSGGVHATGGDSGVGDG